MPWSWTRQDTEMRHFQFSPLVAFCDPAVIRIVNWEEQKEKTSYQGCRPPARLAAKSSLGAGGRESGKELAIERGTHWL